MYRRNWILAASLAAAIAAQPAMAQPGVTVTGSPSETLYTAKVAYGDLQLANDDGVATLNRRVRDAASSVCSAQQDDTLDNQLMFRACRDLTSKAAQPRIAQAIATARAGLAVASPEIRMQVRLARR